MQTNEGDKNQKDVSLSKSIKDVLSVKYRLAQLAIIPSLLVAAWLIFLRHERYSYTWKQHDLYAGSDLLDWSDCEGKNPVSSCFLVQENEIWLLLLLCLITYLMLWIIKTVLILWADRKDVRQVVFGAITWIFVVPIYMIISGYYGRSVDEREIIFTLFAMLAPSFFVCFSKCVYVKHIQ